MLLIGLITLLLAISLSSAKITPHMLTRITTIILLYSAALSYNGLFIPQIGSGLGLYGGLFHVTTVSQSMDAFIFLVGAIILIPVTSHYVVRMKNNHATLPLSLLSNVEKGKNQQIVGSITPTGALHEYSLIILFTTTGATLLVSSADLVSMYLALELQSFAVYILATLYRDSESATSAGLKYFLLGGLSSGFILLGSALIYSYTGLTQFEGLYSIASVAGGDYHGANGIVLGAIIITVGLLFKVAAAPFHNWAPDVYDGVPTTVTTWLTIMPKLSIFVFLLELQFLHICGGEGVEGNLESFSTLFNSPTLPWMLGEGTSYSSYNLYGSSRTLLLVCSLLSLILGTVVGLAQYKIKRLLAYSTISHVGFLLLALAINSEESIESFLFYLVQYSLTTLNTFFILLAFGYLIHSNATKSEGTDIQYIAQLKGQFLANPLLGISLAVCLFSMAGVPPLMGFFAKQMVLYSATHASTLSFGDGQGGEYLFLSLVAILTSVISAAYYLRIIRVIHFDSLKSINPSDSLHNNTLTITSAHSFVIALLTLIILLFVVKPSLILNSTHLLALSLFYN